MGEAAQSPGKPPSPARRRAARAVALVTGATLLTGLLQATGAAPSHAAAGSGSRTATVSVNSLTPRVPVKGQSITISGQLENDGKSAITDAHVGLRMPWGGALSTRSSIKGATSRTGYSNADDGDEIPDHISKVADIPAGGHLSYSLTVPVSALDLSDAGVYQLGVTLDGQTKSDPSPHVLGIKRTFLPWYGDEVTSTTKQTRISYLWPLTDVSHIAPRGDTDSQVSPIFMDDQLATELGPGGRLRQMVDLARNLPVTWVIDPDLLATVEFMTKGYRVAGPGGDLAKTTPGTGDTVAKQWLNDLRTAVAGEQVIALPFGDTDIASLAHHGRNVPGALTHLKTGTALGLTTTQTIFGGTQTADVAWPVDGAIDPSIVSVARAGGAKRIIARSDTFSEGDLSYTPNAARPIGGGTTAVVADATLSTAFTGTLGNQQQTNLAVQSFIAQTLMITMEAPEKQRNVVVAPQRMPTVAQAQAMAEAIHDTTTAPWVSPVSFDDAAKAHPDTRANTKVPSSKAYPSSLRKRELPTGAFKQIQQTQLHLNDFVVILTQQNRVTVPFRNAVLRSLSTSWRGDPAGEEAYQKAIGLYLTDLIGAVHIIPKTALTLSGRSGTIPVTVKNELGQPVKGLVLRLKSGANIRLEIKESDQPITIEGGHTRTLKFQTTASANGTVQVIAQLYTENKGLYGTAQPFDVHINKVTDLVMLIIGAGLLLLVLAGVRIYRQRKRRGDGGDGEDGDDGDDDEADGTDSGQPGDPAADTGQESQEQSPTGEKVDG
ncbi:DUF6049 family protein [Actinacidiphila cocklensis]|uniref:Uncharacterized protein n=1 Tax=Actinacidiphila cocklensis TaxID=887465 RepID=A0A9W4DT58_9ACTN|nr:DUF6049 family protein [Actinacidiphila cocklensis]WSX78142.1 DUF6049 family protein [Streptomyces sp. NBC_00899]CAG6393507.1 conserved exported hypothetical protein [Actinacidiphila cocklensis]